MAEISEALINFLRANPQYKKILEENEDFKREFEKYKEEFDKLPAHERKASIQSIIPTRHIKPNNKLANKITANMIGVGGVGGVGGIDLIVSSKKSKKEVTTKVMLSYDEEKVQFSGQEKYTPYDREVYDGVVTLYEAGNIVVTPAMVYRAMNGMTETEKISQQSLEAVTKSLDKSRFTRTFIDFTNEAAMYNNYVRKTIYDGYLLAVNKIAIDVNGEEKEGYLLLDTPILYRYAQLSGQVISVPMEVLQTKNAVRSTDDVIVIRGYLIRQIEWLKSTKAMRSDNITYQGIYDEIGISRVILSEKAYERKIAKVRNHVKAILDEWKGIGYIVDYVEYKERNSIKGVTITTEKK